MGQKGWEWGVKFMYTAPERRGEEKESGRTNCLCGS